MTEPFRPDDDLVSAVLDDEATEAERARVAADPVLSARLAEFADTAERVGEPVAGQAEDVRDRAIAAAVAERHRRDEVVVAMRRTHRQHNQHLLAVAAAALVVLLAAGFLVAQLGDGDRNSGDTAASGSDDSATDAALESDNTFAAGGGDAEDGDDAAAFDDTATLSLGAVADDDALRNALVAAGAVDRSTLNSQDSGGETTTETTIGSLPGAAPVPGESDDCQIRLEEANPSLDGRLVKASATFAGDPAVVYVFGTADGGRQVTVVAADTCVTLASFPL